MEGVGMTPIEVKVMVETHVGEVKWWDGRVYSFGPDGNAIVLYTSGPNKGIFNRIGINRLRAKLDEQSAD